MTCEEFDELSGAYALEAVTPPERKAAQVHLAECPDCMHRLQELRVVVDALAYFTPQVNPPASLKDRVLDTICMENSHAQLIPIIRNAAPEPGEGGLHRY